MIDIFPLHASIIFGVLVFAATRGLRSFPFKLTAMYAAFFIASEIIYRYKAPEDLQIVTGFIFVSMLYNFCEDSKRRHYVDKFCFVMILAIINYSLLFFSYIALEGDVYGVASHILEVTRVMLGIADICILIGVINGCTGSRAYIELLGFISNGLSRGHLFLQTLQASKGAARQTQAPKEYPINDHI